MATRERMMRWCRSRPTARRPASASWVVQAEKLLGAPIVPSPVHATGRKLAKSVWGEAWGAHLERYSDFSNRLPRGRTYLRNGSVLHLQIDRGEVRGVVSGRDLYVQRIAITPLGPKRRRSLEERCAGNIEGVVDLLSGRLPEAILSALSHPKTGLFPEPAEISLDCSCPDWAHLCKHLAAVLYGVGVRLDEKPELLFLLRGVDPEDLVGRIPEMFTASLPPPERRLEHDDLSTLFDVEIETSEQNDKPLLVTRQELMTVGVPPSRIQRWLATDILLRTGSRGTYELTPEAWEELEPMFEL